MSDEACYVWYVEDSTEAYGRFLKSVPLAQLLHESDTSCIDQLSPSNLIMDVIKVEM